MKNIEYYDRMAKDLYNTAYSDGYGDGMQRERKRKKRRAEMDTETMIRELESVEEKHKHDKVFTGQINIATMAHDVRKRLEELKPYEDTDLTPEQIKELKERDMAKSPVDTDDEFDMYVCPSCNMAIGTIGDKKQHHFCLNCGQRLKWEE